MLKLGDVVDKEGSLYMYTHACIIYICIHANSLYKTLEVNYVAVDSAGHSKHVWIIIRSSKKLLQAFGAKVKSWCCLF